MLFPGVIKYHWRRRRLLMGIFVLGAVAIVLINALTLMVTLRSDGIGISNTGVISHQVNYNGLAIDADPSRIMNPSVFSMLIAILALATIRKDREFLVSCSVPRHQIWLGTCGFLLLSAVGICLVGGLIAPSICRMVMLLAGLPLAGGWSAQTILFGGDAQWSFMMITSLLSLIGMAGNYMLVGYLCLRWWKIILVLFCVMILSLILLVKMVQWETFVAQLVRDVAIYAERFIGWAVRFVDSLMSRDGQMKLALWSMGWGVIGMLLSYPVMRGMKVT